MAGRILIVNDVATDRVLLRVQLSDARYDVQAISSSTELEQSLQGSAPDLILLPNRFESEDSAALCRRLRQSSTTRDTAILVLVPKSDPDRRLSMLAAGADDVLPTPHSEVLLMARIRALLRAKETRSETIRRQETTAALGFAEAPAGFQKKVRVTLIPADKTVGDQWRAGLVAHSTAEFSVKSPNRALDEAATVDAADAIVIDAEIGRPGGGLSLLSDLRSRNGSRHAAILFVHRESDEDAGATALDCGANALATDNSRSGELALRLERLLRLKEEADALRRTEETGMRLAATDPLTGLYNRRYALAYLRRAATEAQRTGRPFALMVADLDHFKVINDIHGHATGDAVLKRVAQAMRDGLRGEDLVARMGGEEFLIVMPATNIERARPAAERIRRTIAEMPMPSSEDAKPFFITMSIGGAVGGETLDGSDIDRLIASADDELYRAKADGRNKVCISRNAA